MTRLAQLGTVEHLASAEPDVLLASDLPLRGPLAAVAREVGSAIRRTLAEHGSRVGHLPCDGSSVDGWLDEQSAVNAEALAADPRVVAVLGPFNSGAATEAVPILNRAGVASVSFSNTYVGLTVPGPTFHPDEPERFAPSGRRTYLRLYPNDFHLAAALAEVAAGRGHRSLFVLHDHEPYGLAVAGGTARAAAAAGLALAGSAGWGEDEPDHDPLAREVAASAADAVVVGGFADAGGRRLLEALAGVPVLAGDGFLMPDALDVHGDLFVVAPGIEPFAVHAAQATAAVLDALARSDGTRAGVVEALFATRVEDGPLGPFAFAASGDAVSERGAVLGSTLYRAAGARFERAGTVIPRPELVAAAH